MSIRPKLFRKKPPAANPTPPDSRFFHLPAVFLLLVFLTSIAYAGGSIYWIIRKDNELEKSRRIELELRNNIKERDYVIQQYRQQIQQLERRVEILDAIQELSANTLSHDEQIRIARQVDEASGKYGHDPFLILALMSTESSLRPGVASHKGAKGLMQLMPSTGRYLSQQIRQSPQIIGFDENEEFDVPHYRNIEGNIELGTLYLTQLMLRFKKLDYAIYAYNLGPNLFQKRLEQGGPFPRKYLAKVLDQYARLTANRRISPGENSIAYAAGDLNRLLAQAYLPSR
ncbi:MAG: lytic transglycosylase domain-containing protein [Candidatus Omnitrophica bacterium]|nr:lytic transglycosylase domain-containing protein [Candidatus Omnitrophota bacterium]